MTEVIFAEWTPDQPARNSTGITEALNVYPRTARSYGPVGALVEYSDALTARCQGAASSRKNSDGTVFTVAGDASKLYLLSQTATSWTNVSGATYSTNEEERWEIIQFGDDIIASNFADPMQVLSMTSYSATVVFGTLTSAAPKARHLAVIRDFVVAGNTYDSTDLFQPNRVWWSAIDNPRSWPTPGTNAAAAVQSDYQNLPNGGWVNGIIGAVGGADGAIFTDTSVYRMQYEGPPTIFRFDEVERSRGTPAPGSIVNVGPFAAYLTEDGFYIFNGVQSEAIGANRVDKSFFTDLDDNAMPRITSTFDPFNKLIVWSYPSVNGNSSPDKWIIWNWQLNRWSEAEVSCEMIFRALTVGTTLEGLDALYPSGLDSIPFSLDSRIWAGGRLTLGAFSTAHKLAYPGATNLAATIDTQEFDSGTGRRLTVRGVRPLVDGGSITAQVRYRDTQSGSLTNTTATSPDSSGVCPQRISARYMRGRVNIAAGGAWSHAQGIDPDIMPEGKR